MAEEDLTLNIRLTGASQAVNDLGEILRLRNALLGGGGEGGSGGGRQSPLGGGSSANVGPANFPQVGGPAIDVAGQRVGRITGVRADPAMRQAMRPVADALYQQARQALVEEVQTVSQRQSGSRQSSAATNGRRASEAAATASAGSTLADQVRQRILGGQVPGLSTEVLERVASGAGGPATATTAADPGTTSPLERQRSRSTLRAQEALERQRTRAFQQEAMAPGQADEALDRQRSRETLRAQEALDRQRTRAFQQEAVAPGRADDALGRQRSRETLRAAESLDQQRNQAFIREATRTAQAGEILDRQRSRATLGEAQQRERASQQLERQRTAALTREEQTRVQAPGQLERQRTAALTREEQARFEAPARLERQRSSATLSEAQQADRAQTRTQRLQARLAQGQADLDDESLTPTRRIVGARRGIRAAGTLDDLATQSALQDRLANFQNQRRLDARAAAQPADRLQEFFGQGPLANFNRAAFGPAILGLSLQFGLAPAFQANQQVQEAGRQFGPFNAQRAGQQTAITIETAKLGQGALQAQQGIDGITFAFLKLANAIPGAGQALAVFSAIGGVGVAAANLAGPIVGASAAIATTRAAQVASGAPATFGAGALGAAGVALPFVGAAVAGVGLGAVGVAGLEEAQRRAGIAFPTRTLLERAGATLIPGPLGAALQAGAAAFNLLGVPDPNPLPQAAVAPVPLSPAATAIRGRIQAEAARTAGFTPTDRAAEAEVASRLEARIGLQQQRVGLDIARQQITTSRTTFAEDQQFARDRLRIQHERVIAPGGEIDINFGRQARDLITSRGRRERDIGISEADAITDVRVGAIRQRDAIAVTDRRQRDDIIIGERRQREDIRTNLGRNIDDINTGAGQNREDIDKGFGRGFRNLIFGQIGGLAGGVLGLMFGRQDALEDVETERGRAIDRARLGAKRAGDDTTLGTTRAGQNVDLGTTRAGEDVTTGERAGISDVKTGAKRQREGSERSFQDQVDDIFQGRRDARDDETRRFEQGKVDLGVVQGIELDRFIRHVTLQDRVLTIQEELWTRQNALINDANLSYEQLVRILQDTITKLGGVPDRINRHAAQALGI